MVEIPFLLNRFDGGKSKDRRDNNANTFNFAQNFDIWSNRHKLTPYRGLEANETKSFGLKQFVKTDTQIYALGENGSNNAKIYQKSNTNDLIGSAWTASTTGEASGGSYATNAFAHYKGFLYGFRTGTDSIFRYEIATNTFTNSYQSVSWSTVAQPVHHPADDNLYFFADNIVYRLDDTTWDGAVLTLPSNMAITCAIDYGNFLAIGAKPSNNTGPSVVYLWNRDSSLEDVSAKINWESGELQALGIVDGILVGVSNVGSTSGFGYREKIHIRRYDGNTARLFFEMDVDYLATGDAQGVGTLYGVPSIPSVTSDNKFYFAIQSGSSVSSGNYTGIWAIGRHDERSPLAVSMVQRVVTDDSTFSDTIKGFAKFGDYFFIAHGAEGSVDRTGNAGSEWDDSLWESDINQGIPERYYFNEKQLKKVRVTFEKLPTNGTVKLEYKVDGGSYTEIFTETTDNAMEKEAHLDVNGNQFTEGREYVLRVTSTGGAEITSIAGVCKVKDTLF